MVTIASATRTTMATTATLISGSGSLNGITAQLSLPSISTSRLLPWRTPGRADTRLFATRYRLVDDALEQHRRDRTVGRCRHGLARLCQLRIAGIVERRPGAPHPRDPGVEIAGRHRLGDEPHLGKAVTAEICRKPGVFTRLVREQVEVGGH